MTLLTLTDVCKAFGVNVILENINLTLQKGQRMGLVGVNGSGKSTLLKVICGEEQADSGTISLVKGYKVGYLTQQADILSCAWRTNCASWRNRWVRRTTTQPSSSAYPASTI